MENMALKRYLVMGYYQEKYTFHQISIFGFNILVLTQKVQNENISTGNFLEN